MMLLLIRNNLTDDRGGSRISVRQRSKLMFEVLQHDALDRLSRQRNCP